MKKLIDTILSGKRKRFLRSRPIYQTSARVSEMDLLMIARKMECKLPLGLSKWLLAAGYGDIENSLSFRKDWFCLIGHGPLNGNLAFAQDELSNIYAYDPKDGVIYFISSDNRSYARMTDDFCSFLQELVQRDYNLAAWRDSLALQHYDTIDEQHPQEAA
ncbi:MAG: hypothetical protein GC139_07585 [Sideroxydans sp.]|nr:hypothetical protein [Sideroxydans sp.]